MASETRTRDVAQGTKLRNSCDACSAAKIKCTQEKPTCTSCAKRMKVCVYSASKRVRRSSRAHTQEARENSMSRTTTATTTWASPIVTALESTGSFSALGSMTSTDFTSSQASAPTMPLAGQDWPDFFATLMLPGTTTSPTEPTTSAEWANLDASIDSFTYLDDSTFDFSFPLSRLDQNNHTNGKKVVNPTIFKDGATTSTNNNTLNFFTRSNGGLTKEIPPFPNATQTDARFASSSSPGSSPSVRRRPDDRRTSTATPPIPRCHCLTRTLRFLAQLSMDPSDAWTAPENGDASAQQLNFEHVHDQIENMSIEVGKFLQCSCSNNGDILVLLSLVIFKIQAWYAAAVNAATRDDKESEALDGVDANPTDFRPRLVLHSLWTDLDGEESEGEDQRRIFIQHVLSKLTGLQILISRLSHRFANAEAESCPSATLTPAAQGPPYSVVEGKIFVLPLSASLLRALSSDLRDRLSGLSRAIAEKLRVS